MTIELQGVVFLEAFFFYKNAATEEDWAKEEPLSYAVFPAKNHHPIAFTFMRENIQVPFFFLSFRVNI